MIVIIQKSKVERESRYGKIKKVEPHGEPIIIKAKYEEQVVNRAMVQIRQLITHKQTFAVEVFR